MVVRKTINDLNLIQMHAEQAGDSERQAKKVEEWFFVLMGEEKNICTVEA